MSAETAILILPMPDGSEVPVLVGYNCTFERNPCDKEPEHYRPEQEDGWIVTDLEIL